MSMEGVEVFLGNCHVIVEQSSQIMGDVEVFHSVPHCRWRAWKCSTLPVEGMEVLKRAWKCSTLPLEGVEVFQAACVS